MDDRKAIKEIKKGNKEYLNLLAEKYYDDIYRFCCYQTGDPDSSMIRRRRRFFVLSDMWTSAAAKT